VESVAPTDRVPRASDITLDAGVEDGQVIVRGGGRIDASTFVSGQAGRIEVTAGDSIALEDGGPHREPAREVPVPEGRRAARAADPDCGRE